MAKREEMVRIEEKIARIRKAIAQSEEMTRSRAARAIVYDDKSATSLATP
jgi:hypothetical protein